MFDHVFENWILDSIPPEWNLIGTAEYTDSIYQGGIRNPLLVATWEGKYFLIGGNRRLLSWKAARAKAESDGSLQGRPWLDQFPVMVYQNIPPTVRSAWSLADNEERSDNPLHAYLTIMAAEKAGDWKRVGELFKYNSGRLKQVMRFKNLIPELLDAVIQGRMTKNVAFQAAKLSQPRQQNLVKMAEARASDTKKPMKITGADIRIVKQATSTAVLQTLDVNIAPTPKEVMKASVPDVLFLVMGDLDELNKAGLVFESFPKAFEEAQTKGLEVYRVSRI